MNQENKQSQGNATNYLTTQNLAKIQEKTELQRIVTRKNRITKDSDKKKQNYKG